MTVDPLGSFREQLTRGIGASSARRRRAVATAVLMVVAVCGAWFVVSRPDQESALVAYGPSSITTTEPAPPTTESGTDDPACAVTRGTEPGLAVPDRWPERPSSGIWYGTVDLWTVLTSDGSSPTPRKSVWWSANFPGGAVEQRPDITVTWQRLDRPAVTIRAGSGTNASTAEEGSFMIAGIDPPSAGCWEVTASYKGATLSYVYWNPPRLWVQPSRPDSDSEMAQVQGIVDYDETSNCFSLESAGLRYPVVWPARTTVSNNGLRITLADGRTVEVGDHVAGDGGFHPVRNESAHDIPPVCVPATGEVAVFNPVADLVITK